MKIKAFKGLRPVKDKAADIASLPYDVVNFEQAAEQAKGKPLSFMRVVRSEIELPEGTEPYSQAVYDHAKENFEKLVKNGHMVREDAPCMYLYRQVMAGHAQTGLVATQRRRLRQRRIKSTKKPARQRRTTATCSRAPCA